MLVCAWVNAVCSQGVCVVVRMCVCVHACIRACVCWMHVCVHVYVWCPIMYGVCVCICAYLSMRLMREPQDGFITPLAYS